MLLLVLCLLCFELGATVDRSPTSDAFNFEICPLEHNSWTSRNLGRVMFNAVGYIRKHEKKITIPITIPHCMDLTFVRVVVDNLWAPPFVDLDRDLHTVTILYRPKQESESHYLVTAKSVPIKDCTTYTPHYGR